MNAAKGGKAKEPKMAVSIPAFHKMLVLAQWALGIFNEVSFENISSVLKHPSLEEVNENDRHNGSSSVQGERRRVREQLCADGFSFEYSATFGQAVAKRSDA